MSTYIMKPYIRACTIFANQCLHGVAIAYRILETQYPRPSIPWRAKMCVRGEDVHARTHPPTHHHRRQQVDYVHHEKEFPARRLCPAPPPPPRY
jgi:hypothetical protein